MSVENAKKFKKDLEENEELKANVKKELEALKDSGKKEKELIPEIARKLGYDFTDEEFKEESSKSTELSDEELANVSGGMCTADAPDGHELECILKWYHGWSDYYNKKMICEECHSTNTYYDDDICRNLICNDCGHKNPGYHGSGDSDIWQH